MIIMEESIAEGYEIETMEDRMKKYTQRLLGFVVDVSAFLLLAVVGFEIVNEIFKTVHYVEGTMTEEQLQYFVSLMILVYAILYFGWGVISGIVTYRTNLVVADNLNLFCLGFLVVLGLMLPFLIEGIIALKIGILVLVLYCMIVAFPVSLGRQYAKKIFFQ